MAKFTATIDMCASITVSVEAESYEDANEKFEQMIRDEDEFIGEHRKEIWIYTPTVDDIVEEEE